MTQPGAPRKEVPEARRVSATAAIRAGPTAPPQPAAVRRYTPALPADVLGIGTTRGTTRYAQGTATPTQRQIHPSPSGPSLAAWGIVVPRGGTCALPSPSPHIAEDTPRGGGRARSLYATPPTPPPPQVLRDSGLGAWRQRRPFLFGVCFLFIRP